MNCLGPAAANSLRGRWFSNRPTDRGRTHLRTDVSVEARVLELFTELQHRFVRIPFISHDLTVVDMLSHRVGVLCRGSLSSWAPELSDEHRTTPTLSGCWPPAVPDPVEQAKRREALRRA